MSRKLIVVPDAERDLIEHFSFLGNQSERAADRFWEAAHSTFRKLLERERGQVVRHPKLQASDLRLWRVDGFPKLLIFYRSMPEAIKIIRVLHGARDWATILKELSGT